MTEAKPTTRALGLDIIRGLAISMVVVSHTALYPEYRPAIYFPLTVIGEIGWCGVDLFFVLSGFLVGGLLLDELKKRGRIDAKRFILRRAFKVWPVYYCFLLTYLVTQYLVSHRGLSETLGLLWPNLVHIQNYYSSTSELGWLWSLGVEEHFYLLLPALLVVLPVRTFFKVGLAVILLCLSLRYITLLAMPPPAPNQADPFRFIFPSHLRFDGLFGGVLLAMFTRYLTEVFHRLWHWRFLILAASTCLLAIPYSMPKQKQFFLYPFGLSLLTLAFCGWVLVGALYASRTANQSDSNWISKLLLPVGHPIGKVFAWIGVRSYSIYVWHGYFAKPLANRLTQWLGITPNLPWIGLLYEGIYLAMPVLIGQLSFAMIEGPFLKLRDRKFPSQVR